MTANTLLQELKQLGVEVVPRGENLVIWPASRVPSDLKDRLKQHKQKIVEEIYHLRVERILQEICRHGAPGMVPWLADHSPLLYHLLTSSLPDRISELWDEHAPLGDFDRVLNDLLGVYFLADAEYRAAREVTHES